MQKILTILRHAKAEAGTAGQDDHTRGLTERGIHAAEATGAYLHEKKLRPDAVLCSTATRARQTWKYVQKAYRDPLPVEYSDKLYLASANETLKLLSATPETVQHLLIVGHNPGFHQLAIKLARKGDEAPLEMLALKFPTCALAMIEIEGSWEDIIHARGALRDYLMPSDLD